MAYQYDIFLSYEHDRLGPWVREHILPLLRLHLPDALCHSPSIFIDEEIPEGKNWQQELNKAIAMSRCMVAIWAPCYFESEWCRFECVTMLHRQQKTMGNCTLLFPVRVSDGHGFPDYAKSIQWLDCRDYFLCSPAFVNSSDYLNFEKYFKSAMPNLAAAIKSAPEWQQEWLNAKSVKVPKLRLPKVRVPRLE